MDMYLLQKHKKIKNKCKKDCYKNTVLIIAVVYQCIYVAYIDSLDGHKFTHLFKV